MIKIAVCDDEPWMLNELCQKIGAFFSARNIPVKIQSFSDGQALVESLANKETSWDVVFLDIQMEGMDGMETAGKLRRTNFIGPLIFITVLREPVFHAFEVQAFEYLLKPLEEKRFFAAMERLLVYLRESQDNLLIQRGYDCTIVKAGEILYCEALNRKIYIHTLEKQIIDYYDKIEALEKRLGPDFFRCHRSYLVNLKYVRGYGDGRVILQRGECVPVSRLRGREFSQTILNYMRKLEEV